MLASHRGVPTENSLANDGPRTDCELRRNGERVCAKGHHGYATGSALHRSASLEISEGLPAQNRRLLRRSRLRTRLCDRADRAFTHAQGISVHHQRADGIHAEFEDLGAAHVDPVSQHAASSSAPLIWDQSTYVDSGQARLWERQAPYGYRSGITVGFHLPRGRHFLFGPDSDQARCVSPAQAKQLAEDIQLFAAHAQAAAFELCTSYDPPAHEMSSLTRGELETLRWVMDGMNRWEIGRKMGLSEREVSLRLQRGMRNLGCASSYERC